MADPFYGEIRAFGFNYAPYQWAYCVGQQVSIQQNNALYAVIANTYGGDLRTYYNLPDMRGLVPQGTGTPATIWPGLPPIAPNDKPGAVSVTLASANLPAHNHTVTGANTGNYNDMTGTPGATSYLSRTVGPGFNAATTNGTIYRAWNNLQGPDVTMSPAMVGSNGGSGGTVLPHENRQPFLVMNFCICTDGEFPSRP